MNAVKTEPATEAPPNAHVLSVILKAVPYAHLISDVDLHNDPTVVRFSWRGARYRVNERLLVEQMEHGCLVGSDLAILMERVLRLADCAMRNDGIVFPDIR